jgi:hypothetical protein
MIREGANFFPPAGLSATSFAIPLPFSALPSLSLSGKVDESNLACFEVGVEVPLTAFSFPFGSGGANDTLGLPDDGESTAPIPIWLFGLNIGLPIEIVGASMFV